MRPQARSTRSWLRTATRHLLLLTVAVVFVGPLLLIVSTALKPEGQDVNSFPPDLIPRPPVLTWIVNAWTSVPFPTYLANSLLISGVGVILSVSVAALAAYPVACITFPGQRVVTGLFIITMFLPAEVMLIPRFLVASQLGLVNTYSGVILPSVFNGFLVFLLWQTFRSVPRELVEAARLDGCRHLRIFWHVMLPVARPTLAISAIFAFIGLWNDFLWPLVILTDSDKYPVALGLAQLAGTTYTDVRTPAAGTVIALIPVIIFFLALQRHIIAGLQGSIKG